METPPVIVVGAGLAGLTAALHLAERGLPPLVLEADPYHCGGRLAGGEVVELNGWLFRLEHGLHAIWSPYRNLQAMLTRHALRPVFVPAQEETWFYKRGGRVREAPIGSAIRHSWIPAPFHYLSLFARPAFLAMLDLRDWLALVNVWSGLLWAMGIDPLREDQPLSGMWLADVLRSWSPAMRALFIGLARNGLTARPEEIPLAGFIAFLRFYTLFRRDAWAFGYLPGDGGTWLVEPLAARLSTLGGVLQLGARVTHLERTGEGWRVHWQDTRAALHAEASQVILANDSPGTAAILRASAGLATAGLDWPRGLPTGIARFWFARSPRSGAEAGIFSGEFTAHNFFWLHRLHDDYRRWHNTTGGSAIEAHIYGPPELLDKPPHILMALVLNDLQSAYPELGGQLIYQMFQRNAATHTLMSLGRPGRHLGIETPWPGLFCCGDWVRHPAPAMFLERACLTGIAAANAVLQARGQRPWPLLDYLPPEPPVALIERAMLSGRQTMRHICRRPEPTGR